MGYMDFKKKRERFSRSTEEITNNKVKGFQKAMYSVISDVLAGFVIDGGKFKNTLSNIRRTNKVQGAISDFNKSDGKPLVLWMFRKLASLGNLNRAYFRQLGLKEETSEEAAIRKTLLRYGFDMERDRLVQNGYLSELFSSRKVSNQVARDIMTAIQSGQSVEEFRAALRSKFIKAKGLGYVESHFKTFTRDLYAGFDRALQDEYRQTYKLNYCLYSGTIIDDTRDFCERRADMIYHYDEVIKWDRMNWQGKIPGVPVVQQCGGYNCRHHLSWLSDGVALRLIKTRGLNQYRTI